MTDVICHLYQINEVPDFRNTGQTTLSLWCFDRESNPIHIRIGDFYNYHYVELPTFVDGKPIMWDVQSAQIIVMTMQKILQNHSPISWLLTYKEKLYYYRGNKKYPMLMLFYNSDEAMRHSENLIKKPYRYEGIGTMTLKAYIGNIAMLRKLFTFVDCKYAQWFQIKGREVEVNSDDRISIEGLKVRPIKEYVAEWKTLKQIDFKTSENWKSQPTLLGIDIETYSDNHSAMPNPFNSLHCAYMVSCIYQKLGDKSTRKKYGILYGECDPIEEAEIRFVKSELELINELGKLVNELDPDIITGYNIFAYDYDYLNKRLNMRMEDWPVMGRTANKKSEMYTKSWKSSAYGYNSLNILLMDGRISIDMLPIIRRNHKLDKYTLDFVCKHFLGVGKHDISPKYMFETYEELMTGKEGAKSKMTQVMRYCLQDSELVIDLFENQKVWTDLIELANVVGVPIMDLFTAGQQIRCVSQLFNLAEKKGIVLDQRKMAKMYYDGGFVFDPIPGLYENIICVDFASLYPSIMEAYNICFTTLIPPELVDEIEDDKCHIIKFYQDEPIKIKENGEDDNNEDLIPGINDEENDEEEEEVDPKKIRRHYLFKFLKQNQKMGLLPQLVHDLVAERGAVKQQMKTVKIKIDGLKLTSKDDTLETIQQRANDVINEFVIPNWEKIILPMWKDTPDPKKRINELESLYDVLDKRQNALKVSANSMYGFLGAQNGGMLPLVEGAMCVTAKGRELITAVNAYAKTTYGARIVYGDTDSSMIDFHITDPKDCDKWGIKIMEEISGTKEKKLPDGTIIPAKKGLFPSPLKVEFEKAMRLLCIRKKKYAALLINKDGTFEKEKNGSYKLFKRGIVLSRRDNAKYLKKTYTELLQIVLSRGSIDEALQCIVKSVSQLICGKIPAKDNLTIIRELGSNYVGNYFMKIFADELRKLGRPANPGDRLEYIIIKTKEEIESIRDRYQIVEINGKLSTIIIPASQIEVPLGYKMRSIEMYEDSEYKDTIDYFYYVSHMLMNPLDQLFEVAYNQELDKIKNIGYQPQNSRCHFCSIVTPVAMLCKIINDYLKVNYSLVDIGNYLETSIMPWFIEQRNLY